MLVSCKICKKKIDRDIAYKVVINYKNNYYCNETEYENLLLESENRSKVIQLSFDIIGNTTNTALMKELKDISNLHTYTKLYHFLQSNINEIKKIMTKDFTSEYGKIRYFTTIIKNKIGDFSYRKESPEESNHEIVDVVKYNPTNKKSFYDFINEY